MDCLPRERDGLRVVWMDEPLLLLTLPADSWFLYISSEVLQKIVSEVICNPLINLLEAVSGYWQRLRRLATFKIENIYQRVAETLWSIQNSGEKKVQKTHHRFFYSTYVLSSLRTFTRQPHLNLFCSMIKCFWNEKTALLTTFRDIFV
jgi:hypothetical protein